MKRVFPRCSDKCGENRSDIVDGTIKSLQAEGALAKPPQGAVRLQKGLTQRDTVSQAKPQVRFAHVRAGERDGWQENHDVGEGHGFGRVMTENTYPLKE